MSLFEKTVQKSNDWIREIMRQMNTGSEQEALLALRGALHALRDRLPVDELAQLGAQLPTLIRGYYYEGWNPAHAPVKYRHISEFLERIRNEFPADAYLDFEFDAAASVSR